MASKRPSALKRSTRAASGGAVLAGVILVLVFFRGSGLGTGVDSEGEGDQSADTTNSESQSAENQSPELASVGTSLDTPQQTAPNATPKASVQQTLTIDEQVATGQRTLGILIDERDYLLRIPGTPQAVFRPSTLERLVELSQRVAGDSNGIRVTILRRETARTTAEQELKAALAASGIGADAVYMPNDFVP
ncbi:MAG: hypothetical protein ABJZ55_21790 [Fuerstiella sp.]